MRWESRLARSAYPSTLTRFVAIQPIHLNHIVAAQATANRLAHRDGDVVEQCAHGRAAGTCEGWEERRRIEDGQRREGRRREGCLGCEQAIARALSWWCLERSAL